MAFKVGSIYGEAILDTQKWSNGISKMKSALNTTLKAVGVFTAAAGAAFTAFVVKSTVKANEFQKALTNVDTLLSSGQVNIADLGKQLLMLDSSLGDTIDLTNGLYQAISSGADPASNAIEVVATSAMFAKAALTDTATAVDVLTTAVNAYGQEQMSANEAADLFFTTIKQGKINGEQLSAVIGQSIPLFASVGIPLKQLSSGLAAMTKQGVSASESTTQLNAIVNSFLKPSEDMSNLLSEIGYSSGSAFLEAEGLTGALELLQEATGGNATELASLLPNVRALRGAMALTGTGGEEFIAVLEEMEKASGATKEAFEKQEKTWDTLRNEIGKTQIIIGNISKFFADDLSDGLQEATNSLNQFLLSAEGFNLISNIIVNAAGSFAVLSHILNVLINTILAPGERIFESVKNLIEDLHKEADGAIDVFTVLGGVLSYFGSTLKVAGEYAAGMIDVITQWIRLVVDAGKTAKAFFDALTGKGTWEEFGIQAKNAGSQLLDVGKSYVDFYKNVLTTIKDETVNATKNAQEEAQKQRDVWENSTSEMRKRVSDNYEKMMIGIFGTTQDGLQDQKNVMLTEGEDLGKNLGEGLEKGLKPELEGLDKVINDWVSSMPETFQENRRSFQKTWNNFIQPVAERAVFVANQIQDAFNEIFSTIISAMEYELSVMEANNESKLEKMQEDKEVTLEEMDLKHEEEVAKLEEQRAQGLISDEEYKAQKEELEKKHADNKAAVEKKLDEKIAKQKQKSREKENEKKKQIFMANKINQIANIWINYATGLVGLWSQSLSQLGPIAGSILAGIMTGVLTGIAIAQTVVIAQQQYIPEKAMGGMAGGLTRINEQGGEIVNLPDGSQVIPNDISKQIAMESGRYGSGTNIIIQMANAFKGAFISSEDMYDYLVDITAEKLSKKLKLRI